MVCLRAVWEHSEKPNYNVNVILISSYNILQGKGTSNFLVYVVLFLCLLKFSKYVHLQSTSTVKLT